MRLKDFTYALPPALIAKGPSSPRDACRLMVLDRDLKAVHHERFYDLGNFLKSGDVLVFNNSKVLPARLLLPFNGRQVELFLIRRKNEHEWFAIGKPGKFLKVGQIFEIKKEFKVEVIDVLSDGQRVVRFSLGGENLDRALEEIGLPPFPPYIKNSTASFDDYQTIYANEKGSVAAPTAGLHFTKRLFHKLMAKGVQLEFVTLHIGLGTFAPIKTKVIEEHQMHTEFFQMDGSTSRRLSSAFRQGRRIIAVGTTSVRVLETSFFKDGFRAGFGETAIFIYPGYQWKSIKGLITNFHLPESTLLLLTSSFAGKDFLLKAYAEAIKKRYRFYSFGDAMFIL